MPYAMSLPQGCLVPSSTSGVTPSGGSVRGVMRRPLVATVNVAVRCTPPLAQRFPVTAQSLQAQTHAAPLDGRTDRRGREARLWDHTGAGLMVGMMWAHLGAQTTKY